MNPSAPIPTTIAAPSASEPLAWLIAIWLPPVIVLTTIIVMAIRDWMGVPFLFGITYPGTEPDGQSVCAWLNLLTMTGVSVVLSWYGCLLLRAKHFFADPSGERTLAALVATGMVIALIAWAFQASDRSRDGELVVAWTIGAHAPTLAIVYSLLGYGVVRLPNQRLGFAILAGVPVLVLLAQTLYLPGESERAAALGFILNSALIALAVGVRLAIWFQEDEPACAPRSP
jgi:hypothetical protein